MIPVWSGGTDADGRYVQRALGLTIDPWHSVQRWHEATSLGAMVVLGCEAWCDALYDLFREHGP